VSCFERIQGWQARGDDLLLLVREIRPSFLLADADDQAYPIRPILRMEVHRVQDVRSLSGQRGRREHFPPLSASSDQEEGRRMR
jgi:hypothetical protein